MGRGVKLLLLYALAVTLLLFVPAFRTPEAYFHARQIESIISTASPFWFDPLSWGGRYLSFSPVFHYVIAAFGTVSTAAIQYVPAFIISTSVIFVFNIVRKLTKADWSAMIGAVATIPVLLQASDLSPISLAIPLMCACTYFLMDIDKYKIPFLISLCLLVFTHPIALVWLFGLAIYLVLMVAEEIPQHSLVQPNACQGSHCLHENHRVHD